MHNNCTYCPTARIRYYCIKYCTSILLLVFINKANWSYRSFKYFGQFWWKNLCYSKLPCSKFWLKMSTFYLNDFLCQYVSRLSIECDEPSENLDNHGGQTESTPVEKHYFIWTNKGVRLYPKYQLYRVLIEGPYIWI